MRVPISGCPMGVIRRCEMGMRVLLRSNGRVELAMSHVLCCCSFTVNVWLRCSVFRPIIMTLSSLWRHRSLIFFGNSIPHNIESLCRVSCLVSWGTCVLYVCLCFTSQTLRFFLYHGKFTWSAVIAFSICVRSDSIFNGTKCLNTRGNALRC